MLVKTLAKYQAHGKWPVNVVIIYINYSELLYFYYFMFLFI